MKTTRTLFSAILVLAIVASFSGFAFATESNNAAAPEVRVNGWLVNFPDAKPFIDENDRTLMPIRAITETFGAKVGWDNDTKTAIITDGITTVSIKINDSNLYITKDGKTETVQMDTQAVIYQDRTCLPVRFIAEAFGVWVGYSPIFNAVHLVKGGGLTSEDIERLQGYYDMTYTELCKAHGNYDKYVSLGYEMVNDPVVVANYSGEYGFQNANENVFRHVSAYATFFKDCNTGEQYNPRSNSSEQCANAFVSNASYAIYDLVGMLNRDSVTVDFKTNAACVYTSKCQDANRVRGVLTLTFANDLRTDIISENVKCGALPFMPTPGQTYTFDAEITIGYLNNAIWTAKIINLETRKVVKE